MAMKALQDFPKIPSKLIERLMNLTLRYFEERSRVRCIYLSFFLSAFRLMLVSNPTVSSMIYIDIYSSRANGDKHVRPQVVTSYDAR